MRLSAFLVGNLLGLVHELSVSGAAAAAARSNE